MSTPRGRIEQDLRAALKAGEKERLSTLRMLLSAITNERIRTGHEVKETEFFSLVRKAIKQREEASEQYHRGGREELAEKEEREAQILAAYLPPAVDEGELEAAIREIVTSRGLSGAAGLGPVMQEMMSRFAGRADGATVSRIARAVLTETS